MGLAIQYFVVLSPDQRRVRTIDISDPVPELRNIF